jgi:metal-responsive CopG/Arc/MetJ family transcriptional regulator
MRFITMPESKPKPLTQMTTFRVDVDVLEAMRQLQERDGIVRSEQIRRALRPWLEEKGVLKRAERKRAGTRTRS